MTPEFSWIKQKIKNGRYQISEHVIRFLMARLLTLPEIEAAVTNGAVVESQDPAHRAGSVLIRGSVNDKTILVLISRGLDDWLIISLAYLTFYPQWAGYSQDKPDRVCEMENPFGRCFFCGGAVKAITFGSFDYRLEGILYVIKNTPAGLCLQCGEKYLTAETAIKINALIDAGQFLGTEDIRVLAYAQGQ